MSQDIIVVAGLFAVLAGIWVVNMVSRKNRMGCIQAMLKEEWGSGHPKEYTYEEFEWISHYYKPSPATCTSRRAQCREL